MFISLYVFVLILVWSVYCFEFNSIKVLQSIWDDIFSWDCLVAPFRSFSSVLLQCFHMFQNIFFGTEFEPLHKHIRFRCRCTQYTEIYTYIWYIQCSHTYSIIGYNLCETYSKNILRCIYLCTLKWKSILLSILNLYFKSMHVCVDLFSCSSEKTNTYSSPLSRINNNPTPPKHRTIEFIYLPEWNAGKRYCNIYVLSTGNLSHSFVVFVINSIHSNSINLFFYNVKPFNLFSCSFSGEQNW